MNVYWTCICAVSGITTLYRYRRHWGWNEWWYSEYRARTTQWLDGDNITRFRGQYQTKLRKQTSSGSCCKLFSKTPKNLTGRDSPVLIEEQYLAKIDKLISHWKTENTWNLSLMKIIFFRDDIRYLTIFLNVICHRWHCYMEQSFQWNKALYADYKASAMEIMTTTNTI